MGDDDDDSSRLFTSGFRANHGDFSPDFQGNLAVRWETATQHRSAGIVETGAMGQVLEPSPGW
jgi:hypothetical protein